MPRRRPVVEGVELVPGLLPDPRRRPGVYRIKLPDGRTRVLRADTPTLANTLAQEQFALQGSAMQPDAYPVFQSWEHLVRDFEKHRETTDPRLLEDQTASWRNRKYALRQFIQVPQVQPARLEVGDLVDWWDGLTRHQQDLRRAEFGRLFKFGMLRGWFPRLQANPFDLLENKPKLASTRERLDLDRFNQVYQAAVGRQYHGLSLAMKISLLTTLRRGDVCVLTEDNIRDGKLRVVVAKSKAKVGDARAARLEWDLKAHKELGAVINDCRKLSLRNGRCPYLISHRFKQRRVGYLKDHMFRMMPDMVTRQFTECTRAVLVAEEGKKLPTFHEIRSLSAALLKAQGIAQEDIQRLMAHTDEQMTYRYQSGHEFEYEPVPTHLQLRR